MSQNFSLASKMTSVFFYGYLFSKIRSEKNQKRLNRRGIAADRPADAEILTLIQKFLHHFKAQELPKIGNLTHWFRRAQSSLGSEVHKKCALLSIAKFERFHEHFSSLKKLTICKNRFSFDWYHS